MTCQTQTWWASRNPLSCGFTKSLNECTHSLYPASQKLRVLLRGFFDAGSPMSHNMWFDQLLLTFQSPDRNTGLKAPHITCRQLLHSTWHWSSLGPLPSFSWCCCLESPKQTRVLGGRTATETPTLQCPNQLLAPYFPRMLPPWSEDICTSSNFSSGTLAFQPETTFQT